MKVELAPLAEIPDGGVKRVEFFGREVILTRTGERPKAIMNACMHLGGPLEQEGEALVCSWHNARWCLADAKKIDGPGGPRLLTLPIAVIDGVVNYVYGESA